METNKIVAALLTLAYQTHEHQTTGNDYRDQVFQTYEYYLEKLAEEEAATIPEATRGLVDSVKKKQRERQMAKNE